MDSADEALALLCRAALDPPRAYGAPGLRLGFRSRPADFRVVEELGFAPAGEGEHLLLRIRKEGQNTRWVAHLLARHYGVADEAVGYCGLKDRRAVAEQWFSIHLPGRRDPTPAPALPHCTVLAESRHRAKLRPGMHRRNRFAVVLRGVPGQTRAALEARLAQLAHQGTPNYFGPQRFGRAGANLHWVAARLKEGRRLGGRGGIYLSAARAALFNWLLGERVAEGRWDAPPLAPLWGRGRPLAGALAPGEERRLALFRPWCDALEHAGLTQEAREVRLLPEEFEWRFCGEALELFFALPAGSYATALLRELAELVEPQAGLGPVL